MSRVFIVQEPMKREKDGTLVSTMDFRPALSYGELVVCLPTQMSTLSTQPVVDALRRKLNDFCDDDYIVGSGDPSAIAIAGAIACEMNRGRMKMLKWDKNSRKYIQVQVDLYHREL